MRSGALGSTATPHADLVEDHLEVVLHGVRGQVQARGDLAGGPPRLAWDCDTFVCGKVIWALLG
jgi:hypothetical protein